MKVRARGIGSAIGHVVCSLAIAASVLGCSSTPLPEDRQPLPSFESVRAESAGLLATLVRVLSPADVATDAGWLEYELLLENRGSTSLLVSSVKLLTASGRYLPAAANYAETVSPPSAAYGIAGEVATSAAGVAAGQVVPYGGLFVRAIADIAEASSADARARAEQRFRLRRVAAVELAPGGRMEGSAFLPRVPDAQALAVDFSYEGAARRVMLPVPRPAGR